MSRAFGANGLRSQLARLPTYYQVGFTATGQTARALPQKSGGAPHLPYAKCGGILSSCCPPPRIRASIRVRPTTVLMISAQTTTAHSGKLAVTARHKRNGPLSHRSARLSRILTTRESDSGNGS